MPISKKPAKKKPVSRSVTLVKRKRREADKRANIDTVHRRVHQSLFNLHKMGPYLTDLLIYTSRGGKVDFTHQVPSDASLRDLRMLVRGTFERIEESIDLLRPYARKLYADSDAAFADLDGPKKTIDIVFDGPPGNQSGGFVEVERNGKSIRFGEWIRREDGYWVLRIPDPE